MTDTTSEASSPPSSAKPRKGIKEILRLGRTSVDQASFYMLRLYRTNLEVRMCTIDEKSLQSDSQKAIYATVKDMLKAPAKGGKAGRNLEWDDIYKAESLIALLYSGAQLRQEISTRLHELGIESLAEADTLRRDYEALLKPPVEGANPAPDDTILRMFLLRIMEAIHWNAKKKYLSRPIRNEATKNILWCLLVSFLFLLLPYCYLIVDFKPAGTSVATSHGVSKWWSLFALYTAITAGLLGAFFSRLISVQRNWTDMTLDAMFLHREFRYTLLRAGVGMCGALIVYFFLRSGIAEGALFPKFDQVRIEFVNVPDGGSAVPMTFVMPSQSLALLTFWCFLAGFSEALVPNILSSTERQLADAATPAQTSRK
jgi:hypothetical protein